MRQGHTSDRVGLPPQLRVHDSGVVEPTVRPVPLGGKCEMAGAIRLATRPSFLS
jgi:hypothetical protein